MLKIYTVPVSLYCAKLRILLRHKGLNWQEIPPPGGYGSDEYKQIVPSGNLPALQDGDLLLADSEAIAEYLNDIYPTPAMLPADPVTRAKARALGRFHDTRLEPALRALFPQIAATTRDQAAIAQGGDTLSRHLAVLAQILNDSALPRDQLWLCDCGFAVTFEWLAGFQAHLGLSLTWPEPVQSYRQHLATIPASQQEFANYRPILNGYLENNR
jgi:glutathione S-transferase/maleylpyruvate isomerase